MRKYTPEFYILIKTFFDECPVCFTTDPSIDKKKNITKSHLVIHRTSTTSFTLKCPVCQLFITVTWKALGQAIGKRADVVADNDEYGKEYEFYAKGFEVLEQNVNLGGVIRHDLSKQKLKSVLRSKL